jgi:hypothetical protein
VVVVKARPAATSILGWRWQTHIQLNATSRSRSGDAESDQDVRGALRGAATQLLAATPLEVLKHPGFWRHLRPAVEAVAGMQNELRLAAGADTVAVVDALTRGHELVAALIGPEALEAAVQLAATAPLGIGDGQGLPEAGWLEGAAPGDVAQLRLAQWVAAQLGLSVFMGCGNAPPSWDLVRRAALVVPPLPELPASLVAAFQAAAPSLLDALATQPLAALAGGRVDFWQLLAEGDEAGQVRPSGWLETYIRAFEGRMGSGALGTVGCVTHPAITLGLLWVWGPLMRTGWPRCACAQSRRSLTPQRPPAPWPPP